MSVKLPDVHSLSDFQRNTRDHIRKLKKTGRPTVLTVNGSAEVVVQSAKAYQRLIDQQDFVVTLQGISRGLEQARRGEGQPAHEFLRELAAEHGITLS